MKVLELRYKTPDALAIDIEKSLLKGRAFSARASNISVREMCELVVVHPITEEECRVVGEAVLVGAQGVGFELRNLDDAKKEALSKLAASVAVKTQTKEEEEEEAELNRNVHDRIRGLQGFERDQLARTGNITERVALERMFGTGIWESLLQNSFITASEVTRIAKSSSLPRHLVNYVCSKANWMVMPEVQRALLANPRCTGSDLEKVLRAVPAVELERLAQKSPRRDVRVMATRLSPK